MHLPTFNARAVPAPQLLAMVALGALHCPLPGSLQLGRVLLEVSRRVVENLVNKDNRLARSLPIVSSFGSHEVELSSESRFLDSQMQTLVRRLLDIAHSC